MRNFWLSSLMGLCFAAGAHATTIFTFSGTNSQSLPVNVEGDFDVFQNNVLTITLTNLVVNPTAVNQDLVGVFFEAFNGQTQLTSGNTTGATTSGATVSDITSSSYSSGFYNGNEVWGLSYGAGGFALNIFNASTNNYTIIGTPDGSGNYSAANGSITSGSHDPFLFETATFTVNIPGLTTTSTISNVQFAFNTTAGENYTGVLCADCGGSPQSITPEPASIFMIGGGVAALAFWRTKWSRLGLSKFPSA